MTSKWTFPQIWTVKYINAKITSTFSYIIQFSISIALYEMVTKTFYIPNIFCNAGFVNDNAVSFVQNCCWLSLSTLQIEEAKITHIFLFVLLPI